MAGLAIAFCTLGRLAGPIAIAEAVSAAPGPRLLILNTVQSVAVMARYMRHNSNDVLHKSTALCPNDREAMLSQIDERLRKPEDSDWTLGATSLVEASVDLSFRSAFRARFSTMPDRRIDIFDEAGASALAADVETRAAAMALS